MAPGTSEYWIQLCTLKRSRFVVIQVVCLLFVAATILVGYISLFSLPSPHWWSSSTLKLHNATEDTHGYTPTKDDSPARYENATAYVKAIMDPTDVAFHRLSCPASNLTRYEYLKAEGGSASQELKYFFALDLRQSIEVLPRLLGSIIEVVRFLGPASCALSIVEGNSDDGTYEVLDSLRSELRKVGLVYFLQSSQIDPKTGERITKLAELRNLALAPLDSSSSHPNANTTVIFLNDVTPCQTDVLELVHQLAFQAADMTCAMDWTYVGDNPTFYDVWVARTLKGNTFFHIPTDGSWDYAWNLFWDDSETKSRFDQKLPFQVFACWNGAVAFGAGPLLGLPPRLHAGTKVAEGEKIRFRAPREGECYGGEPTIFCKDLWWAGFGRIAVVPSVNLEYSDEATTKIKKLKGYTSKWTQEENDTETRIRWVDKAPDKVKCMPGWESQDWRPWNETLL